jgi:signal transduction histidine kinase
MLLPQRMNSGIKGFNRNVIPPQLSQNNTPAESSVGLVDEQLLNMLKIVSHDLRGPLISILATLRLLTRGYYGKTDENVKIKLEELFGKVKGVIGMTEEYLGRAFSVNEDLEIEREILDLTQDIINPVLEELSPEIQEHHIRINNRLDAVCTHPIHVNGNKVWLRAVFRNLLKNAIHYGDWGGMISFGFEDRVSVYHLNVYNRGEPIPEERRNKLFVKFSHIRNNDNEKSNGMGLGLYLVKKIIQKHGGDIWYEPKEHGSNFVITIPAVAC